MKEFRKHIGDIEMPIDQFGSMYLIKQKGTDDFLFRHKMNSKGVMQYKLMQRLKGDIRYYAPFDGACVFTKEALKKMVPQLLQATPGIELEVMEYHFALKHYNISAKTNAVFSPDINELREAENKAQQHIINLRN